MPWLDRIYAWSIRRIFKGNYHSRALTPFLYPFNLLSNGVPGGACELG